MAISEESRRIFAEVKENHRKLRECQRPHDLAPDPSDNHPDPFKRMLCSKCGGTIHSLEARYYLEGLRDGRM